MEALFTLHDWDQLPEGFPAQLLDGHLVRDAAPRYRHQDLVGEIYIRLAAALERRRVVLGPTDVVIDRLNVLQPDVCVVRSLPPPTETNVGTPTLVFEVLSPGTRKRDGGVKTVKYLAAGVEEVWLVDPEARSITIRTTRWTHVAREGESARSEALPDVCFVPQDLFAD